MSWESSLEYYKLLNRGIEKRLGGLHSARIVLSSMDFAELTELQRAERWDDVAALLSEAAKGVEAAVDTPFLHLGDVVAGACKARNLEKVALIGTAFTMQRDFFTDRIASHGLEVLVPDERHHEAINAIIYGELVHGKVLDGSRKTIVSVIEELWDAGAQGVILGCTELELLVKQADSELPVFPCTTLHVEAALDRALA